MPIASDLNKEYKIRDPIYGFIKLDAQEMDIVNSQYFQRLRRIKQLSLTDMVYPGANHNRFEHSLGVMQMASDMFDSIVRKEGNLEKLNLKSDDLKRPRKILRLAALLHDVGHAPFSHAGEELMPFRTSSNTTRYTHEDYSIAAIKLLFRESIEQHRFGENHGIKAEDVTALLGDKTVLPTQTALIWKELISGQIDADRADYLLRDSLHIGVNYGLYDRNMLVNCMTVGESDDASRFLAIDEGGWHVAESLVIARYQMFSQVYFHPVRRAFDYHIGEVLKRMLVKRRYSNGFFPKPTTAKDLCKYFELDDWTVFNALKDKKGELHEKIILNRTPYKCIKEWSSEIPEDERIQAEKDIAQFGGYLDFGAITKWYKLDKDINVYNAKSKTSNLLSCKSKIIEVMPRLPKTIRLFISTEERGASNAVVLQP
ncbi:MAG: HD domain-containing protein [Oscillospiraceae bacterium]|jgi:HD superfamily phosphohydrolase|nr:HD domain-containing protein [Oscillospiraceae bacterium]